MYSIRMQQIRIEYDSGESIAYPAGVRASDLIGPMGPLPHPLVAILANNELKSLGSGIETDCHVSPVLANSSAGAAVYRRSLCFLLAIAARSAFPGKRLVAGMAIGTGFYHFFDDNEPDTPEQVRILSEAMRDLVLRDIDIRIERRSWIAALDYFKASGQTDTLALLENLNDPSIPLNECAGFRDLHVAPLVGSTGVLTTWELIPYGQGMLLRYPHKETPAALETFEDVPVLYRIAEEYRERGLVLGAGSVGQLNRVNISGGIRDLVMISETLQDKKIAGIADLVAGRSDRVKVVLIAGPSSSGKTTTSKKLALQLRVLGFEPIVIELDNYFVNRDRTPRDADGKPDFECLEAIDVAYLNEQLLQLFDGKQVELPTYDFKSGTRVASGRTIRLTGREILVMEGIHGLNDALTPRIPQEAKFRIYVSALAQLNLDDHNRVSTTDERLLRRMVRDHRFRGHSARATLAMWDSVQRGERKYIFPFQNSADAAFNSALDYELGVLKVFADPLLRTVKPTDPEYAEARRIQNLLSYFTPVPAHLVPGSSILREFIGESDFHY